MEGLKQIPNYPNYFANIKGEIYSNKKSKDKFHKLKPQRVTQSKKGYFQVRLYTEKDAPNFKERGQLFYIHRLVWETFSGEIPDNKQIDHIDGDTSNNCLDNLQVVTGRQNLKKYHNNSTNWRKRRKEFIELYEKHGTLEKVAEIMGCVPSTAWYIINDKVLAMDSDGNHYYKQFTTY